MIAHYDTLQSSQGALWVIRHEDDAKLATLMRLIFQLDQAGDWPKAPPSPKR